MHETGRQVHGVPHDRVGPPGLGSEVPDEDDASVDPGAQLQIPGGVNDVPHRSHEVLVVVDTRRRDTTGKDQLPAVAVDVAGEPVHAVPGHGSGRGIGEILQQSSDPFGALAGDHLVGVLEADERDRCLTMLADPLGLDAQPLFQGDEALEVGPGPIGLRLRRFARHRLGIAPQEVAALDGGPDELGRELLSDGGADPDLAGLGVGFALEGRGDVGSREQELPVDAQGQEDGEVATVHPDGDAEPYRPPVALADRLGNERPHSVRSPAGTDGVPLAGEQDEKCVPAEFDDVAALVHADADHGVEARVEQVGQLLGPASAQR